jgi:hypothetical protein
MKKRVLGLSVVGMALLIVTWCLVHAFWPGRWAPGSPLSLRLPGPVSILPGVDAIVRWGGRVHAREHGRAERWSLLGYGEGGTIFGSMDCAVLEYRPDDGSRLDALPRWARRGSGGVARLSCDLERGSVVGEFGVFEMGCLIGGPDFVYSMAFNEEMVRLRLAAERPAP